MSKLDTVEAITIDKEGHKVIIHDADEAKLAALGKKRNDSTTFNVNN
jgi:predicted regulator of Ras-like GTPase activity (Roadblock/LC7/MglB family)